MKFSMKLPHCGPLAGVQAIRRIASEAEDLGYDALWVQDHVTYDTDWFVHRSSGLIEQTEGVEPDFYESMGTLAYVAGFTERIKLGTAIMVLPLRDPRVLARQAMTLQALSNGRLLLGVGTGDYPRDFQVMGVPYKGRARITEEYIETMVALFRGGKVGFQGPTVSFEDAAFFPRVDPIPILMGGGLVHPPRPGGDQLVVRTLRRIARWCHGWLPPQSPPGPVAEGIRKIKDLAREYGRGDLALDTIGHMPMYLADDEVALRKVRRSLQSEEHEAGDGLYGTLFGSADSMMREIEAYQEAGATGIRIGCWAEDIDSWVSMMRVFAKEVMPRFQ